MKLRLKLG